MTAARSLLSLLLVALAALALSAPAAAGAAAAPRTVVSITFDDGWRSQAAAARYLADRQVRATFYVNSEQIGAPNYLALAELRELAARGHEIGGHTLTHAHLAQLSPADVRREVCDDRANLQFLGFPAPSFAYPYGEVSPAATRAVQDCGYTSGRRTSGLYGSASSCAGCPRAETLPLDHRFTARTGVTVRRPDPVGLVQAQVRRATRSGGGWLPLVFHHVCDDAARCPVEGLTLDELRMIVTWLGTQPVDVRPVADVAGGRFRLAAGTVTERARDLAARDPAGGGAARSDGGGPPSASTAVRVFCVGVGQFQVIALGVLLGTGAVIVYRLATRGSRYQSQEG